MRFSTTTFTLAATAAAAAAPALAAFNVTIPPPIRRSPNDDPSLGPCGGADPADLSGGVTDWPLAGLDVTAESDSKLPWTINVGLLPAADVKEGEMGGGGDLQNKTQIGFFYSNGPGLSCWRTLGTSLGDEWLGKDAVLQVQQGGRFQCSAIRFIDGPAAPHTCFHG